ncbi:glycosyltransferase family 2 protein [Lutibacter sp.]
MNIAVLLTCHNRKEKTIACLTYLYQTTLPKPYALHVFLVDDGSTDGTAQAVQVNFPQVNVIQGNGNLFWNQGMRLAWKTASKKQDYDFYLWLNDDTILNRHAIIELLQCNKEAFSKDAKEAIICGACSNTKNEDTFSYGGRTDLGEVIPNGNLQQCTYINGNVVLVPKKTFITLGNLSKEYTHGIGDNDYGLRAIKAGYKCYTTKTYIATCPTNEDPQWANPDIPLKKRFALFYSSRGLNYKEYILFRKKFWGIKWISFAVKAYAKVLFPKMYKSLTN